MKAARTFLASYCLHNGSRGTLHLIAHDSCGCVIQMLDLFGPRVRSISVRSA